MRYIGWAFFVLWVAGMFNVIDFHVCIAESGACSIVKKVING